MSDSEAENPQGGEHFGEAPIGEHDDQEPDTATEPASAGDEAEAPDGDE